MKAIMTALMVKCVFSTLLKSLQKFIHSVFKLAQMLLLCPNYSCMSKLGKTVNVTNKTKNKENIQRLALAFTWLKVYSEEELKVTKHRADRKRRVWQKLHLAVDINAHEIITAELSAPSMTDGEILLSLLKQTGRGINEISADCAYDTKQYYKTVRIKRTVPLILIPPKKRITFWERNHPHN